MAVADQGKRDVQVLFRHAEASAQNAELLLGDQVQAVHGDGECQFQARHVGIKLAQLDADALAEVPGADARRVQRLDLDAASVRVPPG